MLTRRRIPVLFARAHVKRREASREMDKVLAGMLEEIGVVLVVKADSYREAEGRNKLLIADLKRAKRELDTALMLIGDDIE